jgi:hypothetical protein
VEAPGRSINQWREVGQINGGEGKGREEGGICRRERINAFMGEKAAIAAEFAGMPAADD